MATPKNGWRRFRGTISVLVPVLALVYTVYSQKTEATRLAAGKIRNDLVRFASDSELLLDRVYTKKDSVILTKTHLAYTSILREIQSVSINLETHGDLFRFIQPGIYRSDWYREQQSIGESIRSVAAHFHGRLRLLNYVASLQIRIIEYPMSTESVSNNLGIDLTSCIDQPKPSAECKPANASDLVKYIGRYVLDIIKRMEALRIRPIRTSISPKFSAYFAGVDEFGDSLNRVSYTLNNFVQELTTCFINLPDKCLVELSTVEAEASLGLSVPYDLSELTKLLLNEILINRDELKRLCCDDEQKCNELRKLAKIAKEQSQAVESTDDPRNRGCDRCGGGEGDGGED